MNWTILAKVSKPLLPTEVARFTENEIYILIWSLLLPKQTFSSCQEPWLCKETLLKAADHKRRECFKYCGSTYIPWGTLDKLTDSLEKTLMLGKIKGRRRGVRGGHATEDEIVGWHHRLNVHESEKFQEIVKHKEVWHVAVHGKGKESDVT